MLSPSDHLKIKKDKKLLIIGNHIIKIPSTVLCFYCGNILKFRTTTSLYF